MSWRHIKSGMVYSELVDHKSEASRQRGYVYARSVLTGRLVTVRRDRIEEVETIAEALEQQDWIQRERLSELAWMLSRELPYNLGTAVTNIALYQHGGSLLTAFGALRDEMHRLEQAALATQPPVEGEA